MSEFDFYPPEEGHVTEAHPVFTFVSTCPPDSVIRIHPGHYLMDSGFIFGKSIRVSGTTGRYEDVKLSGTVDMIKVNGSTVVIENIHVSVSGSNHAILVSVENSRAFIRNCKVEGARLTPLYAQDRAYMEVEDSHILSTSEMYNAVCFTSRASGSVRRCKVERPWAGNAFELTTGEPIEIVDNEIVNCKQCFKTTSPMNVRIEDNYIYCTDESGMLTKEIPDVSAVPDVAKRNYLGIRKKNSSFLEDLRGLFDQQFVHALF